MTLVDSHEAILHVEAQSYLFLLKTTPDRTNGSQPICLLFLEHRAGTVGAVDVDQTGHLTLSLPRLKMFYVNHRD